MSQHQREYPYDRASSSEDRRAQRGQATRSGRADLDRATSGSHAGSRSRSSQAPRHGSSRQEPARETARGRSRRGRQAPPARTGLLSALSQGVETAGILFMRDRRFQVIVIALLVAIVVLLVLVVASVRGLFAGSVDESASEEADSTTTSLVNAVSSATLEESLAASASWTSQSALDFADILDVGGVFGFDLSGDNETPTLSLSSIIALAQALAPYEEAEVPYGFLIVDLETGLGFACNLDETVYGASSFKAAFCTFVGLTYLDTGEYSLSSTIGEIDVEGADGTTYSSALTLTELITNIIVYSGNEAFMAMRNLFSDDDLAEWLESIGVDGTIAYDTSFPHYTTRAAAALWLTIYQYWQTDSDVAAFIKECCATTETSFLRDALEAAGYDVTVWDKAGWNADGDSTDGIDYNAICDNGIVTYNGRDYLVCVMLGASYSENTLVNAENLMATVFSLIEDLA